MRITPLLSLLLLLSISAVHASEPIKPAQFAKLHALIKPQADEEKFLQIPWMTNLWEARKKAAAEGKPILLWEMDGHPLSCV
jgi:hypothetical protein